MQNKEMKIGKEVSHVKTIKGRKRINFLSNPIKPPGLCEGFRRSVMLQSLVLTWSKSPGMQAAKWGDERETDVGDNLPAI